MNQMLPKKGTSMRRKTRVASILKPNSYENFKQTRNDKHISPMLLVSYPKNVNLNILLGVGKEYRAVLQKSHQHSYHLLTKHSLQGRNNSQRGNMQPCFFGGESRTLGRVEDLQTNG